MSDAALGFGLADAISTLRAELEQAIPGGKGVRRGLPRSSLVFAPTYICGFR